MGDFNFRSSSASKESLLLDQTANNTLRVMERSFCFVENEGIGAAANNRDCLLRRSDTGHADNASAAGLGFFDEVGGAELVFCERINIGDWFAAGALEIMH